MPTGVLHLKEVDTDKITLDGTLSVSGEARLKGPTVIVDNALSVGTTTTLSTTTATDVNVSGALSVGGQTTIGGHIIPDTNDSYDVGSPEFKIRDLYVSDNSLWIGDETKISFSDGKIKFRKRKKDVVPEAILHAGLEVHQQNFATTTAAALAHAGVASVSDMKLQHWHAYMRTLKADALLTDIFRDNKIDYEETSASDAWKEINDTKIHTEMNVGVGTSDPDTTLHVKGSFKVETEDGGFQLIRSSVGATDPQLIIDTKNFGVDVTVEDKTGQNCTKFTKLYRVHGTNSEGVGRDWYWGLANDDYTNISLGVSGETGGNDPDLAFTFTTTSEFYCNKVYAALGGNADTATRLATPRKINGVDFDGTQDITISAGGGSVDGITSSGGKIKIGDGLVTEAQLHVSDRISDSDNGVGNGKARFTTNVNAPSQSYHGNEYGLEVGVHGSGNSSLQTVVYDHSATNTYANYNLLLQPFGGKVGIGKTNPQLDFDVGGNGENTRFGRSTTGSIHGADKRNQMRIGRFDQFDTIGDQGFLGMRLMVDTAANLGMSGEADNQSAIQFYTWGNNVANSREVMRINSLGHVGIGTSTPDSKLHVVDDSGDSDAITTFKIGSGGEMILARNHNSNPFIKSNMGSGRPRWNLGNGSTTRVHINGGSQQNSYFNTGGGITIGSTNAPFGRLDIHQGTRTGPTPPTHNPALYVTSDTGSQSEGVEFRHSNQSQGIGFGYNTIYATGYGSNQYLRIIPRGSANVYIKNYQADSDDRLKTNEVFITNATETLTKLKPQIYDKHEKINEISENPTREAGLIAQEVYYDAPELRFLVSARNEGIDAGPVNIPDKKPYVDDDPTKDPDYSAWGTDSAAVAYIQLVPYLIQSVKENEEDKAKLRSELELEKKKNADLKSVVDSLLSRVQALESR